MLGIPSKKKTVEVNGQKIELEAKPNPISKLFGGKPKQAPPPKAQTPQPAGPITSTAITPPTVFRPSAPTPQPEPQFPATPPQQTKATVEPNKPYKFEFPGSSLLQPQQPKPAPSAPRAPTTARPPLTPRQPFIPRAAQRSKSSGKLHLYIQGIGAKHPELEAALRKEGIKESLYDFIKRMLIFSVIFTAAISAVAFIVLYKVLGNPSTAILLALMVAAASFMSIFRSFLNFPTAKGRSSSKKVERDILFAARDLIIALRSGMPLFNAITSVSSGYGEASKEFLKIVEKVQLGTPLEDAIDRHSLIHEEHLVQEDNASGLGQHKGRSGRHVSAAERHRPARPGEGHRAEEVRAEAQRDRDVLHAFRNNTPEHGHSGANHTDHLHTDIRRSNLTLLEVVLVGLVFLQVVFLQMIRSSRPVFYDVMPWR